MVIRENNILLVKLIFLLLERIVPFLKGRKKNRIPQGWCVSKYFMSAAHGCQLHKSLMLNHKSFWIWRLYYMQFCEAAGFCTCQGRKILCCWQGSGFLLSWYLNTTLMCLNFVSILIPLCTEFIACWSMLE